MDNLVANNDNVREAFDKVLYNEQTLYSYSSKPEAWQECFDKGFKIAWLLKANINMDDMLNSEMYQYLLNHCFAFIDFCSDDTHNIEQVINQAMKEIKSE